MDQCATCLVHESAVPTLLRASGAQAMFCIPASTFMSALELLWLPSDIGLETALRLAKDPTAYGLAQTPRLAVYFVESSALQAFAAKPGFEDLSGLGRWRLTGLPMSTGSVGATLAKGEDLRNTLCGRHTSLFSPMAKVTQRTCTFSSRMDTSNSSASSAQPSCSR